MENNITTVINTALSPIRRYWFPVTVVSMLFIAIIALIIRLFLPNQPSQKQERAFSDIQPGFSSLSTVQESLGSPLAITNFEGGSEVTFKSDIPAIPHQVFVDESQTVQFVKEYVTYDKKVTVVEYLDKIGPPDMVLYDETGSDSTKAHVFLDEGIVLIAHVGDNSVEQRWYFKPTTADAFRKSWGSTLRNTPEVGHELGLP